IQFTNNISTGLNVSQVNRDLIFQLLYNLVNNAIRYNKENGQIKIFGHFPNEESYALSIEDSGIGIKEEELGIIFNRFKKTGTNTGEGYGLGLSIVKSIILFHDFDIKVNSHYGDGTEIIILIPANLVKTSSKNISFNDD